jgi:hypothetical protein
MTTSPVHSEGAPMARAKCDAVLSVTLLGMKARAQSAVAGSEEGDQQGQWVGAEMNFGIHSSAPQHMCCAC